MIRCVPKSLWKWEFFLFGPNGERGEAQIQMLKEEGRIVYDGDDLAVEKHGIGSGDWTLERSGKVCASALKPSAVRRLFELEYDGGALTVKARSSMTRRMDIWVGDRRVGSIWPQSVFRRRAYLDCDESVPVNAQLFAFWLTALTWRRQAAGSGG